MKTEYKVDLSIENELSYKVIGLAMKVHTNLGPGLLESAYKECFAYELIKAGFYIKKEYPLPLVYEDVRLECGYRCDILVENKLLLELKSVESLNDIHLAQILTYLKLAKCKLGLLMNFNVISMKHGIKRVINT